MNVNIIEKDVSEINIIKPLWEKLNLIHLYKSVYFKEKYKAFTFEERMKSIYERAQKGIIKLEVLLDTEKDKYIGYCLCSIEDTSGEIESIFIEEQYRKFGLGDKLMDSALKWFESNGVVKIEINVVYANDEALPFYKKHGFFIGNYKMYRNS